MAQMYPRQVYERAQSGEKLVYEALRTLPQDWVVFHNRDIEYQIGAKHIHYEADFVVLVPHHGVLVIEVKDWTFVRITDGEWEFKGHRPGEPWHKFSKKSPLNQANEAARKLFKTLRYCGILPKEDADCPKLRSLAVLTNAVPPNLADSSTADADISKSTCLALDSLYICGKAALQDGLQKRIMQLFRGDQLGRGQHMTEEMQRRITQYLAPSTVLHLDLGSYLQEMERASANLFSWLPALSASTGDIRVDGCAGSGKTIMACREAARLAAELPRDGEHRILMLCYNLHLADFLREQEEVARQTDIITISNFHLFCTEHLLRATGNGDVLPAEERGNTLTEDVMARIDTVLPTLPRYDYIFVDEAQDFHAEWWKIIRALCKDTGRIFLFVDEYQDIYRRKENLPIPAVRLRLTTNLRNTAEIADFTAAMVPEPAHISAMNLHGAPVQTAPPSDDPQVRARYVRDFIEQLRMNAAIDIPNNEIVILSPWKSSRAGCSISLIGGIDAAPENETPTEKHARYLRWRQTDSPTILGETIKAFKGLEASYVIVTDIPEETDNRIFTLADLYTACSRAKYGLYLVPTVKGAELVRRFLNPDNQS